MKRFYILRNDRPDILERVTSHLSLLYRDKGEYQITIKPHRDSRTLRQNRYYFGAVLGTLLEESGYSVTKEDMHEKMILAHAPRKEVERIDGVIEYVPIRTSDQDVKQFAEYIERIKQWAAEECGIYIPDPNQGDDYWTEVA